VTPVGKKCATSATLLEVTSATLLEVSFETKAIFLKRTNLIHNRRQIAQRNDARAKNNSVSQKEDSKKGITENYRDLFL